MPAAPPVALTIAGSDCSAGAGAQADLKTFQHFNVFGLTAITCIVAETARHVGSVHPIPPAIVHEQIELLLASFPIAAIKTGMLFSAAHVAAVHAALARFTGPLVVDPVMFASTGAALLEPAAVASYRDLLLPRATVITPNLDEAAHLAGQPVRNRHDMSTVAADLAARFQTAVLLKGGHLADPECADVLITNGACRWFSHLRIDSRATHGTGCTFSAGIAAGLALGLPLAAAVAAAKDFLTHAIATGCTWSDPAGTPIHALNQGP
jgi:hydroxymethylpyrimidine/phosphomethylpyrimidine kinase